MVSRRYELTEEQWDRIKQYFEVAKKSGAPWRDLPERYGEWTAEVARTRNV